MRFIKTLFPSFYIWQLFSMSPFTLNGKTIQIETSVVHDVIALISFLIQIVVFIYGLIHVKDYVEYDAQSSLVILFSDVIDLTMIRLISIVIVIESWLNRANQIDFLKLIGEVDEILSFNLRIDMDYKSKRWQQRCNLIMNLVLYCAMQIIVITIIVHFDMGRFPIFWSLYSVPLFIRLMRYNQIISYINLIGERYRIINEFIENIRSMRLHDNMLAKNVPILKSSCGSKHRKNKMLETFMMISKIENMRKAHYLLLDSNKELRNLFHWSLLICIFHDFGGIIVDIYWILFSTFFGEPKVQIFIAAALGMMNIFNFITITFACGSTVEEVMF